MLDEITIKRVAQHKFVHEMGMCSCPCLDALITVGEALKKENVLRAKLAEVSPDALAALTIATVTEVTDQDGNG